MTAIRLAGPGSNAGTFFFRISPPFWSKAVGSSYLWVKALHIIFVSSWFAGLFYFPRILLNLSQVPADSAAEAKRLELMAKRLHRFATILMVPALALGLVLWAGYGVGKGTGQLWMHVKLLLVLCAVGYHLYCAHLLHELLARRAANQAVRSGRWYRLFNEVTVLLFAAIVVLVVVKPI